MPSINLLPWRAELRRRRQRDFVAGLGAAVVVAALVTLIARLWVAGLIDDQVARNDLLRAEIATLDKQIEEILKLEEEKAQLVARMEIIETLQKSRPEVVRLFDDIVRTMPDGVYLSKLSQTDRKLEFNGIAQSSTRVSAFMRNIDSSEVLATPGLQVIETGQGEGASFNLSASLRSAPDDGDQQ
jgi:type IV pilus assembly protein PilN